MSGSDTHVHWWARSAPLGLCACGEPAFISVLGFGFGLSLSLRLRLGILLGILLVVELELLVAVALPAILVILLLVVQDGLFRVGHVRSDIILLGGFLIWGLDGVIINTREGTDSGISFHFNDSGGYLHGVVKPVLLHASKAAQSALLVQLKASDVTDVHVVLCSGVELPWFVAPRGELL
jgi:hypothetical protein